MSAFFPPGDAEYVLIENVPIFHEVVEHDTKGKLPYTAAVIDEIAAVNNARVDEGESPVITVGHKGAAGAERPVLGFLGRFTTGMRNGLRTLFATMAVYADRAGELRSFPRRSIELIQTGDRRHLINGLALIGGSEPALDLGVLCCTSDREEMATFTMENSTQPQGEVTVTPELEAQILATFARTDVFSWAHAQMKAAGNAEAQGEQKQMTEGDAPEGGGAEKSAEGQGDAAREREGEEIKKEKDDENDGKFTAMSAENAQLKNRILMMERKDKLVDLERKGHSFNVDEELANGADLNDEQFERLIVQRVVKFTKRAPIGREFSVAGVNNGGTTSAATDIDRTKRAQEFARKNGCSFKQAWEKV